MRSNRRFWSRSLATAIALGSWFACGVWLYSRLATSDWLGGSDFPEEYRVNLLLEWIPLSENLLVGAAFLIPLAAVLAWCLLESTLRLDEEGKAWASLVWGIRFGLFPSLAVVGTVAAVVLLASGFGEDWFAFLPLLILLLAPLAILRRPVAASDRGVGWWRLSWPGFLPLVSIGLLLTASWGSERLTASIADSIGPFGVGLVVAWIFLILPLLPPALAAVLVFRVGPAETLAAVKKLSRRSLGPCFALSARILFVELLVAVPALLVWFLLWKHVPVLAQWHAAGETSMPLLTRRFVGLSNFVGRYAWIGLLPLYWVMSCFVLGRLVWLAAAPTETAEDLSQGSPMLPQPFLQS